MIREDAYEASERLGFETFEAWRRYPVPAEVAYLPEHVQVHAWHLDQRIWEASCEWCKANGQPTFS